MGIVSKEEFWRVIPGNSRVLALDVGTKTIGLAFGMVGARIATPLSVISRTKLRKDAVLLEKAMREYEICGLVVGWPLNVDGTEGRRCQGVRDTVLALFEHIPDVPAVFHDERFSTMQSENFLVKEVDMSRKRRGEIVDKMAAQVILQDFFETSQ
jgi:putative Holliday junction resolvase